MVQFRRCVVFVGMVVGGCGASWCRQPMGRRSSFDACMPRWFGVGRLACGLFIVRSFYLQQFGWYMVVLAVLWSACPSWCLSRCSPRQRSLMLSLLSSRLVPRFVMAGLSDMVVIVLRPGCARRVVMVRRCCSRQRSACPGLCGCSYGLGQSCLVAVGRPLHRLFPVGCDLSWLVRLWRVCVWGCCVVASTMLGWLCWLAVVFAAHWLACPAVGCVEPW